MNKINLNELTFENVGQWPVVVKIGVVLGVSVLVILFGYLLIIKTNFEVYNSLVSREQALRNDFETKQHQAANLNFYRSQLKVMNERFGAMLRQLPSKNEMPGLLEEISKTGTASGLKFDLFAPQPEVTFDFYIEVPIKIIVTGTYFQLATFLSRVSEMNRIVTLHDFSIERASSKEGKEVPEDELVMGLTAKIYRYRAR